MQKRQFYKTYFLSKTVFYLNRMQKLSNNFDKKMSLI